MNAVMVRYKVKPDRAEMNEELVRAVYEELHRRRPADTRYVTFKLDDGVSFVHLHSSEDPDGATALTELSAFKRFQQGVADRCEDGPTVTRVQEVGSYRLFGPGGEG
jgi:hypothetical protein